MTAPARLKEPQDQAATKLRTQFAAGGSIASRWQEVDRSSADTLRQAYEAWVGDWRRWEKFTTDLLLSIFTDSSLAREFYGAPYIPSRISLGGGTDYTLQEARSNMATRLNNLQSIIERVEAGLFEPASDPETTPAGSTGAINIFIVHGHDLEARSEVARFVEKLGLKPIILEEQTSGSLTIIEKFERDAAKAAAAIVLLTPDDVGRAKDAETLNPRARQNVVFELGYFAARLKRGRVFALKRGGVEISSDYQGVIYTEFDSHGGWQLKVARELNAAGLPVDPAKFLQ